MKNNKEYNKLQRQRLIELLNELGIPKVVETSQKSDDQQNQGNGR